MLIPMKVRHVLASAIFASVFASPVLAQYTGPSSIGQTTVAAILSNPIDDQDVQLQGHLLRQLSHKYYIFSDGMEEIVAEIKPRNFGGQTVDEKTKVEIIGEVDTGKKRPPKIEVDLVRLVN